MIVSKLTSKSQTTIPQPARQALRLRQGDQIAYRIEGGRAVISKVMPSAHSDDPFATFGESTFSRQS